MMHERTKSQPNLAGGGEGCTSVRGEVTAGMQKRSLAEKFRNI